MLLTGRAEITIDAQQRLAVPSKYRSRLGTDETGWYCQPWPDEPHLRLYPERVFEALAQRLDDSLAAGSDASKFDQSFSFVEQIEMDKTGRLRLPKWHLELIGMPTEVLVVGARNRLEIHPRGEWRASDGDRFREMTALYARMDLRGSQA